jgi:hypothetical protein
MKKYIPFTLLVILTIGFALQATGQNIAQAGEQQSTTDTVSTHNTEVPSGITKGRAASLVGGVAGLISLIIGGVALARSKRAHGDKRYQNAAMLLGLVAIILSVVHLINSTGIGTGGGRAGAIVALLLGLIGTSLGIVSKRK